MTKILTKMQFDLGASALTALERADRLRLTCASGLVWVTVEGDPRDHWLASGEALDIVAPGNVVIEAQRASLVELTPSPDERRGEHAVGEAVRRQFLAWLRRPRHACRAEFGGA